MSHTRHEANDCVVDTRLKSRRKVNDVPVATTTASGDSSLAARELSFLVRLAQAAAATQRPDELLDLIIREATSAIGTDVCSLYLVTGRGRELLLTATNGLNERMVGKVVMPVGDGITGWRSFQMSERSLTGNGCRAMTKIAFIPFSPCLSSSGRGWSVCSTSRAPR